MMTSEKTFILIHDKFFSQFIMCFGSQYGESQLNEKYIFKMATDEWRHCVDWLVRCNILPEEHRATQPDASAFDLAQTLRDGVLICHLLNNLFPNSVDLKDFSQRPQLSQVRKASVYSLKRL